MSEASPRLLEIILFFSALLGWCAWELWQVRRARRRDDDDRQDRS
jgi:hypothetical protein